MSTITVAERSVEGLARAPNVAGARVSRYQHRFVLRIEQLGNTAVTVEHGLGSEYLQRPTAWYCASKPILGAVVLATCRRAGIDPFTEVISRSSRVSYSVAQVLSHPAAFERLSLASYIFLSDHQRLQVVAESIAGADTTNCRSSRYGEVLGAALLSEWLSRELGDSWRLELQSELENLMGPRISSMPLPGLMALPHEAFNPTYALYSDGKEVPLLTSNSFRLRQSIGPIVGCFGPAELLLVWAARMLAPDLHLLFDLSVADYWRIVDDGRWRALYDSVYLPSRAYLQAPKLLGLSGDGISSGMVGHQAGGASLAWGVHRALRASWVVVSDQYKLGPKAKIEFFRQVEQALQSELG